MHKEKPQTAEGNMNLFSVALLPMRFWFVCGSQLSAHTGLKTAIYNPASKKHAMEI